MVLRYFALTCHARAGGNLLFIHKYFKFGMLIAP